ncbi:DUF4258 domain-containing protein [Bradyrhizobium sp.]|jgi:hypothetical protein|uniref:DUF4258 domain-containing protein n=1 Tax=Bradyrhizobium sp. TaxID=376 RepID=UPI002E02688C|nr:DUF4258 domain-containing protein [Bradyrhizobium sp.]
MWLPTMSETLRPIQTLVLAGDVRVSDHGFAELAKDAILIEDIVANVMTAVAVEDYPERFRGRSVLALQHDADGRPVHVVWALPSGDRWPAVLVTAYRPDLLLWDDEFKRRKSR